MSKISIDRKKIEDLLTRGVDEVIELSDLEEKLKSGKKLRVKLGIDPTSPNIHLGRSVPLLKLRDFQELGHQLIFIVGDFTGVIGDTSDKDSERPMMSKQQIKKNMKGYVSQASKIINLKECEIRHNSQWLQKLTYDKIGEQADQFSLAEFIARENIKKRLKAGSRISLREILYPLMQGYDSVAVRADVEVGGTDQRFNLLAGREIQKYFGQEQQNIIMGPLLEGTDGRKMSSSWGNVINLTDPASEMFGKVMSIPDQLIIKYFTLVTRVSGSDLADTEAQLKAGVNPRDIKAKLAREIVKLYYDEKSALREEKSFNSQFRDKKMPDDMPELRLGAEVRERSIVDILVEAKLVPSKSEARRMINQGAVKINQKKISQEQDIEVESGTVVQVGKRKFVRIK